ncbi:MAG: ImmA/IrrE family metallo-endopeptidase [Chloroflexota bacterium]|nr:ImmA/IrrE family metallo-endopeptidase [Chloroflexota bacterium]
MARKRPLTMAMARSLHKHLDIPAESLIQPATTPMELPLTPLDVDSFPLAEMASFGWIAPVSEVEVEAHELIDDLYTRAFGISPAENPGAMVAMGSWGEHANPAAIQAWCLQAAAAAHASPLANAFVPGVVTPAFLHAVARLSVVDDGPRLAQAHLAEHGISLQIVPQLPGTHLDGAVLWPMGSYPVIALTLREDRLARFWNGLLHELAHLGLHAKLGAAGFLDDLDLPAIDPLEQQAEEWAREALIPSKAWDAWMIQTVHTEADVASFAAELGIHAMIVAERLREESNDRRRFPRLVGKGLVGPLFGVPSSAQA